MSHPLPGMPRDVVDLSALKNQMPSLGPDKLDVEIFIRYGANYYADVNDAVPMFGIKGDNGLTLPALSLIHEDGSMHLYVLEPPMLAMLRSAIGIDAATLGMLEKVLDGDEEATQRAREIIASIPDEDAPEEAAEDAPTA